MPAGWTERKLLVEVVRDRVSEKQLRFQIERETFLLSCVLEKCFCFWIARGHKSTSLAFNFSFTCPVLGRSYRRDVLSHDLLKQVLN